jgi:hypothetical protein
LEKGSPKFWDNCETPGKLPIGRKFAQSGHPADSSQKTPKLRTFKFLFLEEFGLLMAGNKIKHRVLFCMDLS